VDLGDLFLQLSEDLGGVLVSRITALAQFYFSLLNGAGCLGLGLCDELLGLHLASLDQLTIF
jgi:hypothetical protein